MILTDLIIGPRVPDLWIMAGLYHAYKTAAAGASHYPTSHL